MTTSFIGVESFPQVGDFLNRFASVPDILELDHLTVSGNVTFGRGASAKGTVIIIANHGEQVRVPSHPSAAEDLTPPPPHGTLYQHLTKLLYFMGP